MNSSLTTPRTLAALLWMAVSGVHADSLSYAVSEVKGVQLWRLREGQEEVALDPANEFVRHCDGGAQALLHVGSVPAPVRCKASRMPSGDYRIRLEGAVLPELVVVSLTALPERVRPQPLSAAELAPLLAAERASRERFAIETRRGYLANYGGTAAQYAQRLADIERSPKYLTKAFARWRLPTPAGTLILSPLGAVPDAMGWDLAYAVYRSDVGGLTEIGRFSGCVEGFRDVNGDGVPDVFAATCENDEGIAYEFLSIAGQVQRLMSH